MYDRGLMCFCTLFFLLFLFYVQAVLDVCRMYHVHIVDTTQHCTTQHRKPKKSLNTVQTINKQNKGRIELLPIPLTLHGANLAKNHTRDPE